MKLQDSFNKGELTFKKKEGLERKYLWYAETKKPQFQRQVDKIEACVNLDQDGALKLTEEKVIGQQ